MLLSTHKLDRLFRRRGLLRYRNGCAAHHLGCACRSFFLSLLARRFGLLVLGSPDPHRFEATMGTEFLSRMAELASSALSRMR